MSGTAKCSTEPRPGADSRGRWRRVAGLILLVAAGARRGRRAPVGLAGRRVAPRVRRAARTEHAAPGARALGRRTYRPTVVVRRGTSQGSGTIIASVDGETLVLTAAHVVKAEGPILVELHRYNLGMERHAGNARRLAARDQGQRRGRRHRRRPVDRSHRENDRSALCRSVRRAQRRTAARYHGHLDRDRPGAQADTLEFSVGGNGQVRAQRQPRRPAVL